MLSGHWAVRYDILQAVPRQSNRSVKAIDSFVIRTEIFGYELICIAVYCTVQTGTIPNALHAYKKG